MLFSFDTCTVISVDDGLLRTSTGCAGPSSSSTLYVVWVKVIVISKQIKFTKYKSAKQNGSVACGQES